MRALFASLLALFLTAAPASPPPAADGIHTIQHVVIIMQENRSFDSYFGTYPGADGIAMKNGVPVACLPNVAGKPCARPYHDTNDEDTGGPHGARAADRAIDGGRMDGFVRVMEGATSAGGCPTDIPTCTVKGHEQTVMGYHTARELPDYWAYARWGVLQDHMFAPIRSWSLPAHLYMVSEWAARCSDPEDASRCVADRQFVQLDELPHDLLDPSEWIPRRPSSPWTDITYLLTLTTFRGRTT